MRIRRLRLVLPARYAGTAAPAAREIARHLVQQAAASGRPLSDGMTLDATDRGQPARALAADLARGVPRKDGRS